MKSGVRIRYQWRALRLENCFSACYSVGLCSSNVPQNIYYELLPPSCCLYGGVFPELCSLGACVLSEIVMSSFPSRAARCYSRSAGRVICANRTYLCELSKISLEFSAGVPLVVTKFNQETFLRARKVEAGGCRTQAACAVRGFVDAVMSD